MRGVLVAVMVVAVALSGCTASEAPPSATAETGTKSRPGFEPIASAGWKPGYSFEYTVSTDFDLEMQLLDRNGDAFMTFDDRSHEEGQFTFEVLSNAFQHQGEPMYLVAVAGTGWAGDATASSELLDGRTLLGMRQSDLQPMRTIVHYPDCPAACRPDRIDFLDFDEHYPWLRFPMVEGETWDGTFEVEGLGRMEVASTTLLADGASLDPRADHAITSTPDDSELVAMLEREGLRNVEVTSRLTGTDLVRFDPDRLGIREDHTVLDLDQEVRFTDPDGFKVHLRMLATITVHLELQRSRLTEAAEPGRDGILDGLTLPEAPAPEVDLTADATVVNAADGGQVRFEVEVWPPLEPDQTLELEVASFTGPAVRLEGLEHAFAVPGPYNVTAKVLRGDRVLAKDVLQVDAYYLAELSILCPDVAVDPVLPCPTLALPVRPGITTVQAEAATTGPAGAGIAKLVAVDGAGAESSATFEEGRAYLATPTEGFAVDATDWTLAYRPTVGLADNVTLLVLLTTAYLDGPADGEEAAAIAAAWLKGEASGLLHAGPLPFRRA